MKRCPQCYQTYSDENSFCLSDGTTLIPLADTASAPTIVTSAPFQPPQQTPPAARQGSSAVFIFLGIGVLALLLLAGAAVFWIKSADSNNSSELSKKEEDLKRREQEIANAQKESLQKEQEKIDEEKRKLAEEKSKLLSKPKASTTIPSQSQNQTQTTSSAGAAIVFRPPSNVRESPNGGILCSVTKRTTIKTYGSTNQYDENGYWIYTDVCGKMGVIHSTQIKY